MKKRLSVLLIGSLVALSLAGCSGANTPSETSSVPGESTTESSVQSAETSTENSKTDGVSENEKNAENSADESKNEENSGESTEQPEVTVSEDEEDIGPKEGDIIVDESGNEYIYHEDELGTPIDENSNPIPSNIGGEPSTKYLDVTYTPIDVNDSKADSSAIDMTNPKYYLLSSTAELKDFVSNYENTFSLNDVENGVEFNTLAEKFDDTYFEFMSVIVIPVQYDKNTETEVGTITIEDNDYVIEVCTQPAENKDDLNTLCFVVQANKEDMQGKNVIIRVVEEDMVEEIEEEI